MGIPRRPLPSLDLKGPDTVVVADEMGRTCAESSALLQQ